MATKTVRIRLSEIIGLPVAPSERADEIVTRYIRSALTLEGIDPDAPVRQGVDALTGDLLFRQDHLRLRGRVRFPRPR